MNQLKLVVCVGHESSESNELSSQSGSFSPLCYVGLHASCCRQRGLRQCGDTDEEQSEEFRNGEGSSAWPGSAWPGPARPDEWTLLRLSLSVSSSFQHDNLCTAAAPAVSLRKTRPSHTPLCLLSIRPLSSPLTLISPYLPPPSLPLPRLPPSLAQVPGRSCWLDTRTAPCCCGM